MAWVQQRCHERVGVVSVLGLKSVISCDSVSEKEQVSTASSGLDPATSSKSDGDPGQELAASANKNYICKQ